MLLERDFQFAGFLAGVGCLLVDFGVFDDEEADTEYDQVQVSFHIPQDGGEGDVE